MTRLRIVFVSPVFLFPADAGGKIRTGNMLRALKESGRFETTLLSPATTDQRSHWSGEIEQICDHFVGWMPPVMSPRWRRVPHLLGELPVNVVADRTQAALATVDKALVAGDFDVVVFDFVHSAVLLPPKLNGATVCFTHNVETEIFERHAKTAANAPLRWLWNSQAAKMRRFEREKLAKFTRVIAVSERDAKQFAARYGLATIRPIPTGVDLDYFAWQAPPQSSPTVVFTGSMDWQANVDGIRFYIDEVWPRIQAQIPNACLRVVGRNPPASLTQRKSAGVTFTGFVDDVRDHVRDAQAFVIPLRVGGGTRIKAFEAMALGIPVVSTSIGMEGLDVCSGTHFLRADGPGALAEATVRLLADGALRMQLSCAARELVESRFGHRVAAEAFGRILVEAVGVAR